MIPTNKKPEEKATLLQQLAAFIPVWVQIIICIGGVAVVIAPTVVPRIFPADTPAPSVTASVSETLSPSPVAIVTPLPTVAMTELPCTFTGMCKPGDDWANNCVSAEIWRPYIAGDSVPVPPLCYELSQWGIVADQGALVFAANKSDITAHEYGVFTPWQSWRQVDFSVSADRLDKSEIWFGFFEGDTTSSRGVVFVIQHGDMIDIREMPRSKEIINNTHLKLAGGKYNVRIAFQKGEIFVSVDGQGIVSKHPLNFTIRNMFIGYRSLPVINLDATISNLKFTP